jgi:hypothetical protein
MNKLLTLVAILLASTFAFANTTSDKASAAADDAATAQHKATEAAAAAGDAAKEATEATEAAK